jgi:long-chain fatty acid transport protein
MKRLNLFLVVLLVISSTVSAGGLVTNTNGSAAWARTLTREATTGIDAVYFNPAGLVQLKNGLHLSISNQSIFQTRTITSEYPLLSSAPDPTNYEAKLSAPLFPSVYAAFKKEKWAFSAGFNIIGGGGSANFKDGVPSFETQIASIGASLAPIDAAISEATGGALDPGFRNVTGYNIGSMSMNGSSMYFGFQAGATYAINDIISVALGARVVTVNNSYEGTSTNITIDAPAAYGGTQPPGTYLNTVAMTPGLPAEVTAQLTGQAAYLDGISTEGNLNTVQKGTGFTPIIGLNISLIDKINIAAKYEHHTKIELTNETEVDDFHMFPDGETSRADLPGMFTLGAQVSPIDKLTASVGFNYFLDKPAYYGNVDENMEPINNESTIDENAYTLSASLEYKFLGILGLSAGYSFGNLGVNDNYQSDLSYTNKSNTIAGGVFVEVGELITINAGYVHVMYDDYAKSYSAPFDAYSEIYKKKTNIIAIGVDISL